MSLILKDKVVRRKADISSKGKTKSQSNRCIPCSEAGSSEFAANWLKCLSWAMSVTLGNRRSLRIFMQCQGFGLYFKNNQGISL
jgi:hypothetical protein